MIMPRVLLKRTEELPGGTFGRLYCPGVTVPIYTIERPWKSNEPFKSSIPEGVYTCRPRWYHKKDYQAVEVCDVPGRTDILFHRANHPSELAGCIAVGLEPGMVAKGRGVLNSMGAWEILEERQFFATEAFTLEVTTRPTTP
jgi:hypothetical protein